MKKLLCVLMFGMMFGQTLSTRIYELPYNIIENQYEDFSLAEITNNELSDNQFATIDVFGYSEDSYLNGSLYVDIRKELTDGMMLINLVRFIDMASTIFIEYQQTVNYEPGLNHSLLARQGSFMGTLKLAITAEFPEDDSGDTDGDGYDDVCYEAGAESVDVGDMNEDGGWNVLDIVALANCVLSATCGD